MRIKPIGLSRMAIPLCLLTPMPLVRPTLSIDVTKLDNDFVHGYCEGAAVFYVSCSNDQGWIQSMTVEERSLLTPLWKAEVSKFDDFLEHTPGLHFLKGKFFYICDGNHRHLAWMAHIQQYHPADPEWHINVDSIVLETKGRLGAMMHCMHTINK